MLTYADGERRQVADYARERAQGPVCLLHLGLSNPHKAVTSAGL